MMFSIAHLLNRKLKSNFTPPENPVIAHLQWFHYSHCSDEGYRSEVKRAWNLQPSAFLGKIMQETAEFPHTVSTTFILNETLVGTGDACGVVK